MYVYLFTKDCTELPHDVAHLYEHWFIASFYRYAFEQAGYHGGTIGYIGGETYRNRSFIEAWFYTKQAADLFESFVSAERLYDDLLELCQKQCQAEERTVWTINNPDLLLEQLGLASQQSWQDATQLEPIIYKDTKPDTTRPFLIKKTAKSYKAIAVTVSLPAGTPIELMAVFLRWHVILSDIINQFIQSKGWYSHDNIVPKQYGASLYVRQGVSLPRSQQSNVAIRNELVAYLNAFDISSQMPLIASHFEGFSNQATWQGRPRAELADNNIIVGNTVIARLATEGRLTQLMEVLELSVDTISDAKARQLGT